MIYITGDCHGNFERFNPSIFPEQNEMTKEDYEQMMNEAISVQPLSE